MSFFVAAEHDLDFTNKTVLLGIPSVGNVGQLAMDFLIFSLHAKRIGFIDSVFIEPVIGNDPYYDEAWNNKRGILHTSAEVYDIPGYANFILVIIRAPITNSKRFAQQFTQWLASSHVDRLVILSSANASWRMDNLLRTEYVDS